MIDDDSIKFADPDEDLKHGPADDPEIVKHRYCFNFRTDMSNKTDFEKNYAEECFYKTWQNLSVYQGSFKMGG